MLRRGWAAIGSRPTWRRAARLVVVRGRHGQHGGGRRWRARRCCGRAHVQTPGRARRRRGRAVGRGDDGDRAEGRRSRWTAGSRPGCRASSVMRIDRGDARVEEGAVRFSVPQRRPGHPFVVRAQKYRVVVLGTKFGVAVRGDKQVDVDVAEGVVEVWERRARRAPGTGRELAQHAAPTRRRRQTEAGRAGEPTSAGAAGGRAAGSWCPRRPSSEGRARRRHRRADTHKAMSRRHAQRAGRRARRGGWLPARARALVSHRRPGRSRRTRPTRSARC